MFPKTACAAPLLFALLVAGAAAQSTLTVTPIADGTLYQDATGSLANGAGSLMFTGLNANLAARRAILAFDVSAIPAGSFVCSVTLQVTAVNVTNTGAVSVGLHRVSSSWGEGTSIAPAGQGGGGPATPGDATWLHRFHPSTTWILPGGDMDGAASASTTLSATGPYSFTSTAALAADVQAWVDQPASNHGWILRTPELVGGSMKHLGTREQATAANRPQLTVTWLPGVAAAAASSGPACPPGSGPPMVLANIGLPSIPNPGFALQLSSGPAGATALLFLSPALAPTPLALPNGCFVFLDLAGLDGLVAAGVSPIGPLALDAGGAFLLPTPIPALPCLGSASIAAQAIAYAAPLPGGYTLSNALTLTFGH